MKMINEGTKKTYLGIIVIIFIQNIMIKRNLIIIIIILIKVSKYNHKQKLNNSINLNKQLKS